MEKTKVLKKLWFVFRKRMFSAFLAEYNVRIAGIKLKDIEDVHYLRLYKKGKIFCVNDVLEGAQNQVLDIFSLLKNP